MARAEPPLGLELLNGFRFECRPDCGLCCFASPAVTKRERAALLAIEPKAPFDRGDGPYSFISPRGEGGACHFLSSQRCRVHPQRPFACREYPLLVHVGVRVQATLVLTCPGVDLSALDAYATGTPPTSPPVGFDAEISTVRAELAASDAGTWAREGRSLLRSASRRWVIDPPAEPGPVESLPELPGGIPPGTAVLELPDPADGVEVRPLVYLAGRGVVSMWSDSAGVGIDRVVESGGETETDGIYRSPAGSISVANDGERRMRGYLAYVARRDLLLWQRLAAGPSEASDIGVELTEELATLAATVVLRASVLAQAMGRPASGLTAADIDLGIRASDADWLDQPTLGRVL
jgi:Fe-S-cluster containining protein